MLPPPRKRHGIPLPIDDQLRRTHEDTDVVFTSNKQPALLCCDIVNDSVLGSSMREAKDSGSEEKCSSVFEFDHDDKDEDVGPGNSIEDDDKCTGDDPPELAFKSKIFYVNSVSASNFGSYECS